LQYSILRRATIFLNFVLRVLRRPYASFHLVLPQLAESDLLPLNLEATSKYLRAPRDRAEDAEEAAMKAKISAEAAAADTVQSSVDDNAKSLVAAKINEPSLHTSSNGITPESPTSPPDRAESNNDDNTVSLMAAAARVKVTRSTLARLEADFEVGHLRAIISHLCFVMIFPPLPLGLLASFLFTPLVFYRLRLFIGGAGARETRRSAPRWGVAGPL